MNDCVELPMARDLIYAQAMELVLGGFNWREEQVKLDHYVYYDFLGITEHFDEIRGEHESGGVLTGRSVKDYVVSDKDGNEDWYSVVEIIYYTVREKKGVKVLIHVVVKTRI